VQDAHELWPTAFWNVLIAQGVHDAEDAPPVE
jgi:hypothetical protein